MAGTAGSGATARGWAARGAASARDRNSEERRIGPTWNWGESDLAMHGERRVGRFGGDGLVPRTTVFVQQAFHHGPAAVVEPLARARLVPRVRVRGEERQCHRRVEVADDRIRKTVRIDLPPAHSLGGCRAGEP